MGISIGLHLDLRKTKDYMYPNGLSIFTLNPSSPLSHPVCGLLSNNEQHNDSIEAQSCSYTPNFIGSAPMRSKVGTNQSLYIPCH